jgi:glucose/arabinose dehydrogenase
MQGFVRLLQIVHGHAGQFFKSMAACVAWMAIASVYPATAHAEIAGMQRIAVGGGVVTSIARAPGQDDRLYLADLFGKIRILDLNTNTISPTPFLTIPNVDNEIEGGLLGLTFHPDFANNGKFYVNVTIDNGSVPISGGGTSPFSTHIREYTVNPGSNVANPGFVDLLTVVQPQAEHNGGFLGFSPNDGYLYVMLGDGGGSIDNFPGHTPEIGNAQDLTDNWLGKALRIDVNSDAFPADPQRNYAIPPTNPFVGVAGDDEIWAYGLRNPFQASFDRQTGDLWIGDVGENKREEVDFQPGSSAGGENYGWRIREGSAPTDVVGGPAPAGSTEPVYDYVHLSQPGDVAFKGNSVTGGYVYRGPDPQVQGRYIFADFAAGKFWSFDPEDPYGTVQNITSLLTPPTGAATTITAFGEDAEGNLYAANASGLVFKMITDAVVSADFDGDGMVDADDLAIWKAGYGTAGPNNDDGDANLDGSVDGMDFLAWQRQAGAGPPAASVPEPSAAILAIGVGLAVAACRRRLIH